MGGDEQYNYVFEKRMQPPRKLLRNEVLDE